MEEKLKVQLLSLLIGLLEVISFLKTSYLLKISIIRTNTSAICFNDFT